MVSLSIAFAQAFSDSKTSCNVGSTTAYSACTSAANIFRSARRSCLLSSGIAIMACASRAMALRRLPPSISHRYISYFWKAWLRKRFSILLALPSPMWISPPECPPLKPFTCTLQQKYPAGTSTSLYINSATESIPPAQPIKSSPSSSESRFSKISPFMKPSFKAKAPVSPVSSSTVNRHSRGPC